MKKRILILLLASLPFLVFGQGVPELMYYRFDGGGNTVLNQASTPVGTNPAPVNGTLSQGATGQFGQALVGGGGTGTANTVNTGWPTALGSGNWTISFWIGNWPATNTFAYLFGDNTAGSFRCFSAGAAGTNNVVLRGPIPDVVASGVLSSNSVVHYVRDGGQIRAYVNGVLNNTVNTSPTINGSNFYVGGYTSTSMPVGGRLDEFRMYNRALTQAEITATWNQPLPLIVANVDMAATGFSSPSASPSACFGPNETITLNIANFGQNPIDFSTNNATISVTVTGPNPQNFNTTLTSGTLASGAFQSVTISTGYNMSAPGTYNFNGSITVAGDGNPANNMLPAPVSVTNTAIAISGSSFLETFDSWGTRIDASFNGWTSTPGTSSTGLNWESEVDRIGQSSPGTGPLSDHTTPNTPGVGSYIFLETSAGAQGDDAEFESPCIDLTAASCPSVSFWYHMFGNDIGTLFTEINSGGSWITVDQIVGAQQTGQAAPYLKREVPLGAFIGQVVRLRFRATKGGTSFNGDIAIDDVEFTDSQPISDIGVNEILSPIDLGQCFGQETISLEVANKGCTVIDFAVDPVRVTTTVTGVNPMVFTNDLTTGTLPIGGTIIINNPYNMSANGVHTFNASTSLINGGNDGNPGNDAAPEVSITNFAETVTLGNPYFEDFDSFSGNSGTTSANQNGWVSVPGTSSTGLTWESDFNGGNSFNTGPVVDHTNPGVGRYVFLETSAGILGDDAEYESPCIDLTQAICPELTFWYHMFGATMGDMAIEVLSGTNWIQVDFIDGLPNPQPTQTSPWLERKVKLGPYAGQVIRVRFRGIRGGSFTSDMAIDDVMVADTPPIDDIGVTQLLNPLGASCGSGMEPVIVEVSNFGCTTIDFAANNATVMANITGTFPQSPSATVSSGTLAPGDVLAVTVGMLDLSQAGVYNIGASVSLASGPDADASNDALGSPVTFAIAPPITSGPGYFENFDSGPGGWVSGGASSTWAFGTPAKTSIIGASSDPNAWVTGGLGTTPYNNNENSFVLSPGLDFSTPGLGQTRLEMDIWWDSEFSWDGANVQYSTNNGGTWNLLGAQNNPPQDDALNWYNDGTITGAPGGSQVGWSGENGPPGPGSLGWVPAGINLPTSLLGQCGVLFRVNFGSDASVNAGRDGFAFDNFRIFELPPIDFEMIAVTGSWDGGGCNLGTAETVEITIRQKGTDDLPVGYQIPVSLSVDGGAPINEIFTLTAPLLSGNTATYTFTAGADLSVPGAHTLSVSVDDPADAFAGNNSLDAAPFNNEIVNIANADYFVDFEAGESGWSSGGSESSWAFGTPAKIVIQGASSGVNAWVTGGLGTGLYNANEDSYIEGPPCFDFSDPCIVRPKIELDVWWESEFSWDGANVQYSTNGGASWNLIGSFGDPNNWYTDNTIVGAPGGSQEGWSGRNGTGTTGGSNGWVTASHDLPASIVGSPQVSFRVYFGADASIQDDGFAVDNIRIFNDCFKDGQYFTCSNGNPVDLFNLVQGPVGGGGTWSGPVALGNGSQGTLDPTLLGPGVYTFTYTEDPPGSPCECLTSDIVVTVTDAIDISQGDYEEDFENGPNGWDTNGIGTWSFGTPNKDDIVGASSGSNAWVTGGLGSGTADDYQSNWDVFVEGPSCFDFSSPCVTKPVISMDVWWDSEFTWDGANLQYSEDGGANWNLVGNVGDPDNWYNANIQPFAPPIGGFREAWSGTGTNGSGGWVTARHELPAVIGKSGITFRVAFGSDGVVGFDGFAFDNVVVNDDYLNDGELEICANADPVDLFDYLGGSPIGSGVWAGPAALGNGARGTFDPSTMPAGIYTYSEDINNQCPCLRATVTVTKTPAPDPGLSSTLSICSSANPVDLLDVLGGTPDDGGSWSGPSALGNGDRGTFDPASNAAGLYTYTASTTGCNDESSTVSVTVIPAPGVPIVSDLTVCEGQSTEITPSGGASYNFWDADPASGNANLLGSGSSYDPGTAAGSSDVVWVTSFDGTCDSDAVMVTVTVNENPTAMASSNSPLFVGQTMNLMGNGGVSYMWTGPNGFSSAMQNPSKANVQLADCGVFTLTVTDGNGCMDAVTIAVLAIPASMQVNPVVALEGAYDRTNGLMRNDLQQQHLIPLTEPYTGLGITHNMPGASITGATLDGIGVSAEDLIVDWVMVELRDEANPAIVVASRPALLQRDGDVVDTDGVSPVAFGAVHAPAGNYHVAIRHRNHLGIMSDNPISLSTTGTMIDFTDPGTEVYHSDQGAMTTVNGINLLWSGDVLLDGELRYSGPSNDRAPILSIIGGTDPTVVKLGQYHQEDVNMDGMIQYSGPNNDRKSILDNIGGVDATNVVVEHLP